MFFPLIMLILFYCKIMLSSFRLIFSSFGLSIAFFSIWNHSKNKLFYIISVMFGIISRIYFFFFSIQNIKSNCYIIFVKFYLIIFFWCKIYSFTVTFFSKELNFCYSLRIFFLFLHDLTRLLQRIKNIFYLFYWWQLLLLFLFFYPIRKICIRLTTNRIYFMTFLTQ